MESRNLIGIKTRYKGFDCVIIDAEDGKPTLLMSLEFFNPFNKGIINFQEAKEIGEYLKSKKLGWDVPTYEHLLVYQQNAKIVHSKCPINSFSQNGHHVWLWSQTCDGKRAYTFDYNNYRVYHDTINTTRMHTRVRIFYDLKKNINKQKQ